MFNHTIDNKPSIVDSNGNTIVDLATSIFGENAGTSATFDVKKMTSYFEMRPDLVALLEYGTINGAEYILKYTGISNPFSLKDDDILMIPNMDLADEIILNKKESTSKETDNEALIRNYFRFVNQDYESDTTSYEALENMNIPSAVQSATDTFSGDYIVPYISEDGTTPITILNGRMYFGTDAGFNMNDVIKASTTNLDEKIQAVIDSTATAMSDSNCMYNGTTLANFVRTTIVDNFSK